MSLEGMCAWIEAAFSCASGGHETTEARGCSGNRSKGDEIKPNSETASEVPDIVDSSAKAVCSRETRVLVHCVQGISRSGAIVVAYLMRLQSLDYDSALALAQNSRSVITPNSGFADQLRLWAQMEYSIYSRTDDNACEGLSPKLKPQYELWKSNRGILLSRGEEAKQRVMAKSMADMAAKFGQRRLQLKRKDNEDNLLTDTYKQ